MALNIIQKYKNDKDEIDFEKLETGTVFQWWRGAIGLKLKDGYQYLQNDKGELHFVRREGNAEAIEKILGKLTGIEVD